MNRAEFMNDCWRYYRILEDKLIATSPYVEIDKGNYGAFSIEYALLIQAMGAELDNFFKVYCGFQLGDRKNIDDYSKSILKSYPKIVNQVVSIPDKEIELQPFKDWDINDPAQTLPWWQAFNNIKHNRIENKSAANQYNALNMLAALCILEMKYISLIVKKDSDGHLIEPDIPDSKSRLFELKDWSSECIPITENVFGFLG